MRRFTIALTLILGLVLLAACGSDAGQPKLEANSPSTTAAPSRRLANQHSETPLTATRSTRRSAICRSVVAPTRSPM